MIVTSQAFHSAKDRFTTFQSWGKGESVGAKVVDALARRTRRTNKSEITEWTHKGRLMFRTTALPKQPGDVFPQTRYEIL
jgi:hypothetical protein